jgi:hypothetical protein
LSAGWNKLPILPGDRLRDLLDRFADLDEEEE